MFRIGPGIVISLALAAAARAAEPVPVFSSAWKTLETRWRAFTLGRFAPRQ